MAGPARAGKVRSTYAPEIQALLGVARSRAERETLLKVLAIIQK